MIDPSGTSHPTDSGSASADPTEQSDVTSPEDDGLSAQERADRAAIEAQWIKSWEVYAELPSTPPDQREALARTAMLDAALTGAIADAQVINDKGWDTYGEVGHRISWPKPIDGGDTALIDDCMDTSRSGSLETSTGDKTTVGVSRLHVRGTLVKGADGVWRVSQNFFLKDEPC